MYWIPSTFAALDCPGHDGAGLGGSKNLAKNRVPGLVNCYITNWKDPPFLMGKSM